MKKTICVAMLMLAGCDGGSTGSKDVMSAEFRTMTECVASIQASAGSKLKNTATDTPDRVAGWLMDGRYFACDKKETGTKGTYFEGIYDVK